MNCDAESEALAEYFRGDEAVAAVYLFGSVATGRAKRGSDIDVGVLFQNAPPATMLG